MLEINKVRIVTLTGQEIVNELSFSLHQGDKLAVIGEEGNGKSTLLKAIYNENSIKEYATLEGCIAKQGMILGYLEQFLNPMWFTHTVLEYFVKETPQDEIDYEKYAMIYQVEKIFQEVGLKEAYLKEDKKIGQLSGGEKVKLQMAKLLGKHPDILLLDEPTNDLDRETLEWLENFLEKLTLPIMVISHDTVFLEHVSNAILHLEQLDHKKKSKYTYEHIGYLEYIQKRKYLLSKQEQVARSEKREYEKQVETYQRMFQQVESDLRSVSRQDPGKGRLLKKKMKSVKTVGKKLENTQLTEIPYVEEAVVAKFHHEDDIHTKKVILDFSCEKLMMQEKELSKNVALKVIGKQKIGIVGRNGCGKTTLLKNIYEEMKTREDIKVGYMPQYYEELLPLEQSPITFLKETYTKEEETLSHTYLGSMKFTIQEMKSPIGDLSGGQKAKLLIVKLIMQKCNVLLLDEPTRNLSPLTVPIINELLREFKGSIISISHDRKYLKEVCDTIMVLDKDGLHEEQ